eukprot:6181419-Pleurochrysis_carterae.AAC.1
MSISRMSSDLRNSCKSSKAVRTVLFAHSLSGNEYSREWCVDSSEVVLRLLVDISSHVSQTYMQCSVRDSSQSAHSPPIYLRTTTTCAPFRVDTSSTDTKTAHI